jgi:hypothetical protein
MFYPLQYICKGPVVTAQKKKILEKYIYSRIQRKWQSSMVRAKSISINQFSILIYFPSQFSELHYIISGGCVILVTFYILKLEDQGPRHQILDR